MKTFIHPVLESIRKHSVLTEITLVGFAVTAFVLSLMLGLPSERAGSAATQAAQVIAVAPGGSDPAGS